MGMTEAEKRMPRYSEPDRKSKKAETARKKMSRLIGGGSHLVGFKPGNKGKSGFIEISLPGNCYTECETISKLLKEELDHQNNTGKCITRHDLIGKQEKIDPKNALAASNMNIIRKAKGLGVMCWSYGFLLRHPDKLTDLQRKILEDGIRNIERYRAEKRAGNE